jgi:hypothetical protein
MAWTITWHHSALGGEGWWTIEDENGGCVASQGCEATDSDGRLIAAAPLMLAELRRLEWDEGADWAHQQCPNCRNTRLAGHAKSCTLAAALRAAGGGPG